MELRVPPCPDCGFSQHVGIHEPWDNFERKYNKIKLPERHIVFRCGKCKVDWLHVTDPYSVAEIIEDLDTRVRNFKLT